MKVIELTLLFIGAIIGAGFATGAEIVAFFGHLNLPLWFIAVLIAAALFGVLSLIIFLTNTKFGITLWQQPWYKLICLGLYLILFTAMTAGISQIAGVLTTIGSLIFASLMVKFGFQKMTRFNLVIVTSIIIILGIICLPYINHTNTMTVNWSDLPSGLWWSSLYAGMNCFILPELIIAARHQHSTRPIYLAGLLTAIIIAGFVYLILNAIKATNTTTAVMPLLAIQPHPITFTVILLAILTSQYAALFALSQQAQKLKLLKTAPNSIWCGLAFLGSFCGFGLIVKIGYPIIGAFTCAFLLFAFLVVQWQQRHHPSPPCRS